MTLWSGAPTVCEASSVYINKHLVFWFPERNECWFWSDPGSGRVYFTIPWQPYTMTEEDLDKYLILL
jgi:hypothetical protein